MKTLFTVILFNISIYSQLYMAGVAPLKPNNTWKYIWANDPNEVELFKVLDSAFIKDSVSFSVVNVISNNNSHTFYMGESGDSYVRFDSTVFKSDYKYLKKDCIVGDSWVSKHENWYGGVDTFYYSVVNSGLLYWYWFGLTLPVKYIDITDHSLTQMHQCWNDSLGLIYEIDDESYTNELRGCVIDGIVYGDTSMTTGINDPDFVNPDYQLLQNYPNPFNPTTKIRYFIPQGDEVEISVYNLLGQKIQILEHGYQSPGSHEIMFDGSGLSSGVYFYEIKSGIFSQVKKMIFIQ